MGEALPDVTLVDALFRSTVIGVALLDSGLRYVRINEALAALSQRPVAEHIGAHIRTLAPALAEVVQPWLEEVLQTRRPHLQQVLRGARSLHGVLDILPHRDGLLLILADNTSLLHSERVLLARLRLSELLSEVSAGFIELRPSEVGTGITRALQAAAEAFDADLALVACFVEDGAAAEVAHRWEREPSERPEPERVAPARVAIEKGPDTAHAALPRLASGHDVVLGLLTELERAQRTHLVHLGALGSLVGDQARSLVAMPLRMGRDVTGFVCFVCVRRERDWNSEVLTSMRVIVEIIASAMHRKQQEERIEERLKFEALVARLSREFVSASLAEMDAVVLRALQTIGTARPFGRAVIYRRDPSDQRLELWHEWLAPGMPSLRPTFLRVLRSEIGYVPPAFFLGESVVLDAEALDPEAHLTRRIMQDGVRLIAIAPLVTGGKNWGTLALHATTRIPLPPDFPTRLTLVGELFASVIARLDAERARERAYAELLSLKGQIERERDYLREEIRDERQGGPAGIIGRSPALLATLESVAAVAATQATVLIRGESGVGKELIARAIHDQSPRRDGPLVRVNCASIPRELFESEFFGHVRGSFTGALKDRAGRFELADRGTLFLDEVGDIPLDLQAKLLRVLQEGQYERIGEDRTRTVNVRLLAATNRNLEEDIAAGRFRSDLYYRLATFPLIVPPLRERGEDVLELARHYLALYSRSVGRRGLVLTPEHERLLMEYPWPGNVRELAHVIERAVILSTAGPLRLDLALPKAASVPRPPHSSRSSPGAALAAPSSTSAGSSISSPPLSATSVPRSVASAEPVPMTELKRMERNNILAALEKARWRVAGPGGAAELLGLRPTTLRDRMRALGLRRES